MQGFKSTIDEIEADLRFCEDVLNSTTENPSTTQPAGSASVAKDGSDAVHGTSSATGTGHQPPQLLQQERMHLKPSDVSFSSGSAPGAAKARTTEDLLHMLSSVPEGQPFEIDTRLLYSPQSSFAGGAAQDSPGARSCSYDSLAWEELMQQHQMQGSSHADSSALPAHQPVAAGTAPLHGDAEQEALALGALQIGNSARAADVRLSSPACTVEAQRSQQHVCAPPAAAQQALGWQHGIASTAVGPAPCAASHQPQQQPNPTPHSSGSSSQRARRLQMENVPAADGAESARQQREDRLAQLARPRTRVWQQCAAARAQQEEADLQECTFKPRTGRPPTHQRVAASVPVEERLQLAWAGRQQSLERARREKEKEHLADCTFAPQLVTKPEQHLRQEYVPLHQRVGLEQKRRTTKMAQAQMRKDLGEADLTFQPQLNERSLRLAAQKEARGTFQQGTACGPTSAGTHCNVGEHARACTFSPSINVVSERLLEGSATVPSDFQERLRYYSMRKQLKQRAAMEAADSAACTFRPDIGSTVQVLALSSRAGNLLETAQERYDRLAGEEAERLAARRAALKAEVYGSMHFRPQLNPRSVAMAPSGSGGVEGLASLASKQQQRLAELSRAEEERQRQQCTFQPNTTKPRVRGYYDEYQPPQASARIRIAAASKQDFDGLVQDIAEYQAEKQARLASIKAEEEAKELAECRFAPDINHQRVQARGPVVVRGLDRYLELKQLAERQRAEAEQRAAKVFHQNPRAKQGATVPQPFQLAGHAQLEAKASQKQAALLEAALRSHQRDCTFQPSTNHKRRQEQLQQLWEQPAAVDI